MTAIDLLVTGDFLYPMSEGCPVIRVGEVAHIKAAHGCGSLVYPRNIGYLCNDVVVAHLTQAGGG